MKRTPLGDRVANPERYGSLYLGDADIQDGQSSTLQFIAETNFDFLNQGGIRLHGHYIVTTVKIIGAIITVIHSDIKNHFWFHIHR